MNMNCRTVCCRTGGYAGCMNCEMRDLYVIICSAILCQQKRRAKMSVIILGGNECMERQYKDLCKEYKCRAKVFIKPSGSLKNKLGNPDLMICFTGALSHKVLKCAQNEIKGLDTKVEHSRTASMAALRSILEKHAGASVA